MPSVSQAQFGKMGALYQEGKISRKTLRHFNKGVHPGSLPKKSPIAKAVERRWFRAKGKKTK